MPNHKGSKNLWSIPKFLDMQANHVVMLKFIGDHVVILYEHSKIKAHKAKRIVKCVIMLIVL